MKIAVTRLRGKDTDDSRRCADLGHICYSVSPLKAEIHEDRIDRFIDEVNKGSYDCIFFTSALPARLIAPRLSRWPRVIAIGPQTTGILTARGIRCEVLPRFYSREFVPYLGDWIQGKQIGIPRADVPNPALMEAIKDAGGTPDEIRCYSLVPTNERLDISSADAVLFTSAFSFRSAIWDMRPELILMAIGEITAAEMRTGGIIPHVTGNGSLEGVLNALNHYIRNPEGSPENRRP
ncbi:MAG TPA: uroporphyrinogen-III synthase [Methanoregulaceae archaeon]|nr:uroporphyrinogen-III synthase [Methanoregulaceae archaeon]